MINQEVNCKMIGRRCSCKQPHEVTFNSSEYVFFNLKMVKLSRNFENSVQELCNDIQCDPSGKLEEVNYIKNVQRNQVDIY